MQSYFKARLKSGKQKTNQTKKTKKQKKHMIFGGFNEMSSNMVYTSCYKNHALKSFFKLNNNQTQHVPS